MDKIEASKFELVRILPKSRPPLPRMAGLKYQKGNSSDYEYKTTNYDDDEDNEDDDEDDNIDDDADDDDDDNIDNDNEINDVDNLSFDDVDSSMNMEHIRYDLSGHIPDNLTPPLRRNVNKVNNNPDIRNIKLSKDQSFHKPNKNSKKERTERHVFCWVVMALIPILCALFFLTNDSTADNLKNEINYRQSKITLIKNLEENIDHISEKFHKQSPDIWIDIIAGVAEVINHPTKPAIIFLFANQDDTMLCLAKMIANASKSALGSDNNLWLSASDLGNDYGLIIDKFKDKIEKQKIVIVDNLLNINPKAILAFHHLCDRENPLVKKAVYIITMVAEGYTKKQKPIEFVENQLLQKMEGSVDAEKIQPLITRITDGPVISIEQEPDILSCPLRY